MQEKCAPGCPRAGPALLQKRSMRQCANSLAGPRRGLVQVRCAKAFKGAQKQIDPHLRGR